MNRIEMNVETGESVVVELTPDEVAAAQASTAKEEAKPTPKSLGLEFVDAIKADPNALASLKAELAK